MTTNAAEEWENIWNIDIITFNLILNCQSIDGYFKMHTNKIFLIPSTIHAKGEFLETSIINYKLCILKTHTQVLSLFPAHLQKTRIKSSRERICPIY